MPSLDRILHRAVNGPVTIPSFVWPGLLAALLWTAGTPSTFAQEPSKYWIFLNGKPGSSNAEISDEARLRRTRRGRTGHGDHDRRVAQSYVKRLQAMGIYPVVRSRWLNAVSARLSPDEVRRVGDLDFVRSVRPVGRRANPPPPPAEPASSYKVGPVEYGPSLQQLAMVNAADPLERGIDGSGVRLGFLDASFGEFDHPAFARLREEGRLIAVRDFVGMPQEGFTHGLSVASVAVGFDAGSLVGPAHGAEVLGAITEYGPTETNEEEDYFVAGLEWLEAMGADVVNVSLGYTTFDAGEHSYTRDELDGDTGVTTVAADYAASLGVVVVVSAGNQACSSPDECWYYIGTPADGDSVISVAAVRPDSARASFSSFGPTADGRIKPDVAAAGSSVYVAAPNGYSYSAGTSFSSPMVAGIACQMLQVNPSLGPMDVLALLRTTASRAAAPDNELGWGIVDAAAAVDAAALGTADPPSDGLSLSAPYPNPATDEVFIHIMSDAPGMASVDVFDLHGRRIISDLQQLITPVRSTIRVATGDLASGVYFFTATHDRRRASGTFVVAR